MILKPPAGKKGEPQGLIFIQGAYCEKEAYTDQLKAL
jgi:hypothetical protein